MSSWRRRGLLALPAALLCRPQAAAAIPRFPMPDRLVVVGDIHGDCAAFKRVLRTSCLILERR